MRNRSAALPLVLLATMAAVPARADQSASGSLAVVVVGLHSGQGQIGCLLYDSAAGFPRDPRRALRQLLAPISNQRGVCHFEGLKAGRYAVLAMHDENGNGVMDRSFLGIPREGFGASRGARGTFGPKFEDAQFSYGGGSEATSIVIRY